MTLNLPLSESVKGVDLALKSDSDELAEGPDDHPSHIYRTLQSRWALMQLDRTSVCIKTRPAALFES